MYNIGKLRVITRWMAVADCTYKNIFYSLIIKFHLMFNSLLRNEIEKSILILFYATGFIIIVSSLPCGAVWCICRLVDKVI